LIKNGLSGEFGNPADLLEFAENGRPDCLTVRHQAGKIAPEAMKFGIK
jgi:hypothetical protein